jgi:hypothetical protein
MPVDPDQARAAMRLAGETYRQQTEIKRQLEEGETYAHCVLDDPALKNVYLRKILKWQRGWGNTKVQVAMSALGAFNPRCPDLTEEQRAILSYYCSWRGRGVPPEHPDELPRHPADR